jgi:hypothetical protein
MVRYKGDLNCALERRLKWPSCGFSAFVKVFVYEIW